MVIRAPAGRLLAVAVPLGVLLGVLVAAGVATLLGGLPAGPANAVPVPATGTVIGSTPCAQPRARDTVVFVVDGRSYELPLDGCGNPEGIQLDVELVTADDGTPAVRLAGAGAEPHHVIADRAAAMLLVLAGLAGALLVVVVSR
ncbi:MAG TPA: hypothetical protein VGJ95_14425 [Pseudonocardiaceae bacterium]